ncbi:MAG: hypothetical protein H7267_15225 [Sandarakinorhabdus sp.]|nr:hypothetical protein [Sandarakinorhabdus sp.]
MKLLVHGLIVRRASTVGEITAAQELLSRLMADLDHLDATIRIFQPDIDLEELPMKRVPPPNAAFRGEVQRFLLHTLRHASVPMTTLQLATAVMESRNLNVADKALHRKIAQRTGHSLGRLRRLGFVQSEKANAGGLLRWQTSRKGETGDPEGGWRNGHG